MEFISTAGDGYLKVTHNQLLRAYKNGFGSSPGSFFSMAGYALLEENDDMARFIDTYPGDFDLASIRDRYQERINVDSYVTLPGNIDEYRDLMQFAKIRERDLQGMNRGDIILWWDGDKTTYRGYKKSTKSVHVSEDGVNSYMKKRMFSPQNIDAIYDSSGVQKWPESEDRPYKMGGYDSILNPDCYQLDKYGSAPNPDSIPINELEGVEIYDNGGETADRYTVVIDTAVYTMSDNATSPRGINKYIGDLREINLNYPELGRKLDHIPESILPAIKDHLGHHGAENINEKIKKRWESMGPRKMWMTNYELDKVDLSDLPSDILTWVGEKLGGGR